MRADQHLTRFQRALLRLTLEHGARWTIGVVSAASVAVSLAVTSLSFQFFDADRQMIVLSILLSTFIPILVAPLASHVIVSLVMAVASINDELERLATTDSLTGLANRRRFFAVAEEIVARHDPGTVTLVGMADLDAFKEVNDQHGHATGDIALTTLADRLKAAVGEHHGIVGRLGGDEFGVVLTVTEDDLATVTDELQRACADIAIGPDLVVGASLGLSCPDDTESIDDVLGRADAALYETKVRRSPRPRASSV